MELSTHLSTFHEVATSLPSSPALKMVFFLMATLIHLSGPSEGKVKCSQS
ncbi:hypothetical protein Hamer_G001075 [Homarus americanus]|uniref:Uncharacterized protein n=1 Tax=Homarus americanus TaxID=6706 RepID=A0A8J5TE25_HOMAM|nr:hypothetical protein Hamer_G001075 [Homarus americanus]